MNVLDANRKDLAYQLESELSQAALQAAERDPNQKLAWVNSICILILLIGVFGSKPASVKIKPVPPIEQVNAAIVEPLPPPPKTQTTQTEEQNNQEQKDTPQVVVVTPESPTINFSVPTIGNLLAPADVAQAPPAEPMRAVAPLRSRPSVLNNTGNGGERPLPPYPKIAKEQGEQGSVTLRLNVDDTGLITQVEVVQSSGFPVLDRGAMDYVKRHWTVPPQKEIRTYEATINYKLE